MYSKRPLDGGVGSNCVADCFSPSFALHCCVGLRRIDPKGPSFLQSSPPGDIALGSRCWLQTAVVPSESFSFSWSSSSSSSLDACRRLLLLLIFCQWSPGAWCGLCCLGLVASSGDQRRRFLVTWGLLRCCPCSARTLDLQEGVWPVCRRCMSLLIVSL